MQTDTYDRVAGLCRELGKTRNLYYIARIQERSDLAVLVNNGKT
jgi:hypothetical protein